MIAAFPLVPQGYIKVCPCSHYLPTYTVWKLKEFFRFTD